MTDEVQNTTEPPVPPLGEKPYDSDDTIHLILAYLCPLSLIPFFMYRDKRNDPKKDYVYFHARQGTALGIVVWAICIVFWILSAITLGILGLILCPLSAVVCLGAMAISIMGWVKAFKGEKWEMPGMSAMTKLTPSSTYTTPRLG